MEFLKLTDYHAIILQLTDTQTQSSLPAGTREERDGWAWSTPVVSTQLLILLKGY